MCWWWLQTEDMSVKLGNELGLLYSQEKGFRHEKVSSAEAGSKV